MNLMMDFVYAVLYVVTQPMGIGKLPPEVLDYVTMALEYMAKGSVILSQFVDMSYLLVLYMIIFEIDVLIFAFRAFMWLLRKIPLLGIK